LLDLSFVAFFFGVPVFLLFLLRGFVFVVTAGRLGVSFVVVVSFVCLCFLVSAGVVVSYVFVSVL
jgi:hypothetical protein